MYIYVLNKLDMRCCRQLRMKWLRFTHFGIICGGVLGIWILMNILSFLCHDWSIMTSLLYVKPLNHSQNDTNMIIKPKNILCYSLYGSNPRYTDGAIANAKLYKEIYPGWIMRVYYDNTVPKNILDQLIAADVELVDMTGSKMNKMSWRFQGVVDADRSCARDIDSHLSLREKAAVDQWIQYGKDFHTMRDHPNHSNFAMSGGMWCSKTIPNMIKVLNMLQGQAYLVDMDFLNKALWPVAQKSVMQHDSFSCEKWGGGLPFPTERVENEFVGSVYINGKTGGVDSSKRKKIDKKCLRDNLPSIRNE